MTKNNKIVAATVLIWVCISIAYAYIYVTDTLTQADLQSYEGEWQFQLLMFAIFRLPILVGALAVIIGIEVKFLHNKSLTHHSSGTPNGAP